jgi:hypothetical protein
MWIAMWVERGPKLTEAAATSPPAMTAMTLRRAGKAFAVKEASSIRRISQCAERGTPGFGSRNIAAS